MSSPEDDNPTTTSPPTWQSLTTNSPIPFRYQINHTHRTWAKTHYTRPELYLQPTSVPEIQQIVNVARKCRKRIIVVGCGHSPSDLTIPRRTRQGDTWIVNLDRFSKVVGFEGDDDEEEEREEGEEGKSEKELLITVEAGIRLHQLSHALSLKGWNMPNLGSIWDQSLAGAIATATHGSSTLHGLLSENIKHLTIMLSDGKSYVCSAGSNPELFEAALVGLGALGIVTHVTYKAVKAYRVHWSQEIWGLSKVLDSWNGGLWEEKEFVRVWWFPYSERTVVWRAGKVGVREEVRVVGDGEDGQEGGNKVKVKVWDKELTEPPHSWYGTWLGYHTYQIMLYIARWFPKITPYVEKFVFRTQYGWDEGVIGEAVEEGEKALLLDCLFSQYVNEWAIPLSSGPQAITRLQSWLTGGPFSTHQIPIPNDNIFVHAPIEVRVTNSSYTHISSTTSTRRALLDTSYPDGPSLYLNATLYRPYLNRGDSAMRRRYYLAFEWLMRQYGGKPHWAKNFLTGGGGEVEEDVGEEEKKEIKRLLGGGEIWDEMYGVGIRRWRAIRRKVDPEGVFRSEWLERTVLANEKDEGQGQGPVAVVGNGAETSTVLVDEAEGLEFMPIAE